MVALTLARTQGTQANLPPALFLHGFLGSRLDWADLSERLSQSVNAVSVDLPGHGESVGLQIESYSMTGTAELVLHTLDELSVARCDLIGYSMGARLGLHLVVHHSDRFRSAVLISGSPGLEHETERKQRRAHDRALAERIQTSDLTAFLNDWYNQPLFATLDRNSPEFAAMLERRRGNNPDELAKSLIHMGTGSQESLWDRLPDIKVPVLLIVGEQDEKFRDINRRMASLCPTARLAIIPKAGHNVVEEQPRLTADAVTRFLNSL